MKLLKFYKDTCYKCNTLDKILTEFNLVPIESINYEKDTKLVDKFQVKNTPTLILVDNNGEFLRKITGHITRDFIETIVKSELRSEVRE